MRRPIPSAELHGGAPDFVAWIGKEEPKRGPKKRTPRSAAPHLQRAIAEVTEMQESGEWEELETRHLVALYAQLHERVYGAAPVELVADWAPALSAARKLQRDEFGDEPSRMLEWMRWVWKREREGEKWAASEKRERRRISWRLMFMNRQLVTDYRVAAARQQKRASHGA
jgi:hypothetical protein